MRNDIVGAPRPRILVHGMTDEEVQIIKTVAGSVVVTQNMNDMHAEEHDVLVLAESGFSDLAGVYPRRLVFAPKPQPDSAGVVRTSSGLRGGSSTPSITRAQTQTRPARDFDVTESVEGLGLEALVRSSCVPPSGEPYVGMLTPVYPERDTTPLLAERLNHGLTLAAFFGKEGTYSFESVVWLPDQARSHLLEWLKVALSIWHEQDPDRVPSSDVWGHDIGWASPAELTTRQELDRFDVAEDARIREVRADRQRLVDAVVASETAGTKWRALLTETGDNLVNEVRVMLEELGFTVVDSDSLPEHKGLKREDLRVMHAGWTALVEVKGYTKTAKSRDLLQTGSVVASYAATEGRPPNALWYVPNTERLTAPGQRVQVLRGRDEDVETFRESFNGCVVDTRELFALRQQVALGSMQKDQARQALKDAAGRFQVPKV